MMEVYRQETELLKHEEDMIMLKQAIEKSAAQHKMEIQSPLREVLSNQLSNLLAILHSGGKPSAFVLTLQLAQHRQLVMSGSNY